MPTDRVPPPWDRVELVVAGTLAAALFVYFYRSFLLTGFDGIFGDLGDARILIAILEHWFAWVSGAEPSWSDTAYFHPASGGIGLTDGYVLYGLIYSGFRATGLDMFRAFMAVMLVLTAIGFASFIALARAVWGASPLASVTGASLFAFANMMAVKIGHAQGVCAMLLPVVILLVWYAVAASRPVGTILAGAAGLLLGLVFFTAYHTGWFAVSFTLAVFVIHLGLGGSARLRAVAATVFVRHAHLTLGFAVGLGIGLVPFLAAYLPMLRAGKAYGFDAVVLYAPRFADIVNTGHGNVAWGMLLTAAGIAAVAGRPLVEVELGYTPLVFATVCVAVAVCTVRWFRGRGGRRDDVALALGLALVGYWLMQLDYFGFRPWSLVWTLVPGSIGVRTTFRSQLVVNLAACLLVAFAIDRLARPALRRAGPAGIIVLAVLLVGEQVNRSAPSRFWRSEQTAWLATVPPPPAGCRAFYLSPQPQGGPDWWRLQSDAMILSAAWRLPTLNGNASQWPDGWQLDDPADPRYPDRVRAWIARHHITGPLCGLALDSKTWSRGAP
ncbi:MAG: hypothetical protein HXX10_19940 [Rhodoplanes sp.]|uniref:hypothetical protein n=1 Tax=Rhodoplanes sp. TaxID=1968906 RepID=UPI0017DD0603|nr:hypothetical protein [Rhodoplanes sp.]NVO16306.1 hypothetical protein [Rhodoplanes sp.]